MQDAFLEAGQSLHQLRDPDRFRAWTYAIARHQCSARFRRRRWVMVAGDDLETFVDSVGPMQVTTEELAEHSELVELVRDAASGLAERDRALLDLNTRQGLEGDDLAEAMGVTPSQCYVLLSRLRDRMERTVGALLVARGGRKDCDQLSSTLGSDWDGRLSPRLRKRLARHVDECGTCERRRRTAGAFALSAAVPVVPIPEILRSLPDHIGPGSSIDTAESSAPVRSPCTYGKNGFPLPCGRRGARRSKVVGAAIVAIVAMWGLG